MELIDPIEIKGIEQNEKLSRSFNRYKKLIDELRKKEIPDKVINDVNTRTEAINKGSFDEKAAIKTISKTHSEIVTMLEKELKIVPKNHYRNTWLAIGMAVFGLPLGLVYGSIIGNTGMMSLGIPIGMVIGMAVGAQMDKKAAEEGRQLDLEA